MKILVLIVPWILLLPFQAASSAPATTPAVKMEIDATQSLGAIKPLFRDFCEGGESPDADYLEELIDEMRVLRPRILRFDNAITDFVKFLPGGKNYDFSRFDKYVSVIREMGAEPLVCLSYSPPEFAGDGDGIAPPNDFQKYAQLAAAFVRHANQPGKIPIRYWEIWNEPNHTGFWSGTLEQYLSLYEQMSLEIRKADPSVKIGGPATAGYDEKWIDALLLHVKEKNLPLDFLSWHTYFEPPANYLRNANSAKGKLDAHGLKAELILDEWNYHPGLVPENDDHRGAAFIADVMRHMVDSPLDYAPFFEPKDGWTPAGEWWGRWGLFTFSGIPKAYYFTFQAFSRLAEERISLTSDTAGVDGIATRDENRVMAILYNNQPEDHWVDMTVKSMPSTGYLLTRWLVDAVHSNPIYETPHKLQRVERVSCFTQNSRVERSILLPEYSVSLLEFRPDPYMVPMQVKVQPESGNRFETIPFKLQFAIQQKPEESYELFMDSEVDGDRITPQITQIKGPSQSNIIIDCTPSLGYYPGWRFHEIVLTPSTNRKTHYRESLALFLPARMVATPVNYRIPGQAEDTVQLDLTNNDVAPLNGVVNWRTSGGLRVRDTRQTLSVPAHGKGRIETSVGETISATGALGLDCHIKMDDGYETHRRYAVVPILEANRKEGLPHDYDLHTFHYVNWEKSYIGSLNVRVAAAWDEEALHLSVQYPDETHVLAATPQQLFLGDSLQIALDMGFDARLDSGYDDNDYEFGVSSSSAWCWKSGASQTTGPADYLKVSFKTASRNAVFGISIPWSELGSFQPESGKVFGFSLLINDEDGKGRTCASLFGDISGPKDPYRFGGIRLRS